MDIGREIFIKNVRRIRYIHNELSENAHEKKRLGRLRKTWKRNANNDITRCRYEIGERVLDRDD